MSRRNIFVCVAILILGVIVIAFVQDALSMARRFEQIHRGMSYDEVIALLGEPTWRHAGEGRNTSYRLLLSRETMGWGGLPRGEGFIVVFEDGKALSMCSTVRPTFISRVRSWLGLW